MKFIFCSDPIEPKQVDVDYKREYDVVKELGYNVELMSFEQLVDTNNPQMAISNIKTTNEVEIAIYRGWMLKPDKYLDLYNALITRNIKLINTPENYKFCHYLPDSYDIIRDCTPKTIWFSKDQFNKSLDEVCELLIQTFGDKSIIIKDYVKSRKHEWNEACFIPNASDSNKIKQVVSRFLELQGDDLNEGIVFREFLKLEFLTLHSKSKMPLTKEFRIFFLNGEPLKEIYYWDEGDYGDLKPDIMQFVEVAKKIKSHFFTMDIAKVENGGWIIIELGDGQVSGFPIKVDLLGFYKSLIENLN